MSAIVARKMWRTLEPYHGLVYFTPRATEAYAELGITGHSGYFASRAAAMGPVPAEVVIATFYNFNPALVRSAIPVAWESASPSAILDARMAGADAALRESLGDEVVRSDDMRWAAETAQRATQGCSPEGRPLYAAHAALPWPDEPHLVLWQAIALLREFRGDGHIAALVVEGIDGCEALVTHAAAGELSIPFEILRATRGWSDDEWAAAGDRLRARGWLDADGELTTEGTAARERVERVTDDRAMAPWLTLGEETCDQLRATIRPWSKTIAASAVFASAPGASG